MFIIRSSKPSKHDQCCYGSVCKSIKALSDEFEVYVQISHDENNPEWEKVGMSYTGDNLPIEEINRVINLKQIR